METLSSNRYRPAAEKSSEIIFTADIFGFGATLNNSQNQNATSSSSPSEEQRQRQDTSHTETSKAASRKSASNRHAILQDPVLTQRLSSIHPAFRPRPISGRAGDVIALDDRIARNGGTTSTYEQLPHRLRISKQHQPTTSAERVIELTRTNGYLLQELAYYKDTQTADMKFFEKVTKTHADLEDALEERSQRRANAESTLLSYWGIDFGDGNVEDTVF